jgi:FkbM family methyltransferase
MLNFMSKPEYFFCPTRVFWRIKFSVLPPKFGMQKIKLIWGRNIIANPSQTIGKSLYTYGLYDLPLTEMICRLVRPGDLVIDAGSNIGYTSCLMQDCLEGNGELISFEPLPELFTILKQNLAERENGEFTQLNNVALSHSSGNAVITLPQNFENNDGIATLQESVVGKKIEIKTTTIDSLNLSRNVRLLKLDVEGHEYEVLRGASESLKKIFLNIYYLKT